MACRIAALLARLLPPRGGRPAHLLSDQEIDELPGYPGSSNRHNGPPVTALVVGSIGQLGAVLDFGKALEGAALIVPAGILAASAAALWWVGFVQATKENETAAIVVLFLALVASWAAIALGIAWAT